MIHDASPRQRQPLVQVNCAALSTTLFESELFGHEKGSFTDAVSQRIGRFESAAGGSLFLDEISEIPVPSQAKLLRVLESGEFERVGNSDSIQHNVRIIASTNRQLEREVKDENFRLDLYHRLNVISLSIPPLRERREDIPLLASHFVKRFKSENTIAISGFTREAMQTLSRHSWPGNVRELRNVIHRACVLTSEERIDVECLQLEVCEPTRDAVELSPSNIPEHWLECELAEIERAIILAAVHRFGNQRIVAEKLGVSTRTLTNKIGRYRQSGLMDSA